MSQFNNQTKTKKIIIIKPDDWHVHLRDDGILATVLPFSEEAYERALVMPNLKPPITTVKQAIEYWERIIESTCSNFTPYMTLYLTDNTTSKELFLLKKSGYMMSVKYYPAGATTNSGGGVTDIKKVYHVFKIMEQFDIPLNIHGEVTYGDIFGREKEFIKKILIPLRKDFPRLQIVLEHITTKYAVDYILEAKGKIAGTITPQHLMFDRNDMLVGGVKPHLYCLPILKKNKDRMALIDAATSGNPRFFLGTDSAPHLKDTKENSCGCAGCFTPYSIQMYAEVFDKADELDKLEGFASKFGADFYGLPYNNQMLTLERKEFRIPDNINVEGSGVIVPLMAGQNLEWSIKKD
jgi:dihydroorotase